MRRSRQVAKPEHDLLERAARNNARWCDAVCRAHQRPGEFSPAIWINRHEVPPFYPNAITLTQGSIDPQVRAIEELGRADIPARWAVKDSFAALDLSPIGFQVLFAAQWIVRDPSAPVNDANLDAVRWATIARDEDLAQWERAWSAAPGNQIPNKRERLFAPPLLAEPEIAFIAAYQDGRIVAGCTANRSDGLAGMSNMFLPKKRAGALGAGCVAAVVDRFPGLPIVAYEAQPDSSRALGFETIGPLTIWMKLNRGL